MAKVCVGSVIESMVKFGLVIWKEKEQFSSWCRKFDSQSILWLTWTCLKHIIFTSILHARLVVGHIFSYHTATSHLIFVRVWLGLVKLSHCYITLLGLMFASTFLGSTQVGIKVMNFKAIKLVTPFWINVGEQIMAVKVE